MKKFRDPIDQFVNIEDLPLLDLGQIYLISSVWYDSGMKDVWGTFDVLVRDLPTYRNFLVFAGLEEICYAIKNWRYTDRNIQYLLKQKLVSADFAKYLKKFKFTGSIDAMPEGTIFFPQEPVIRVTAPLIEANLLTNLFLLTVHSNSIFASKFVRAVIAAQNKNAIGIGPQRAHGIDAVLRAMRASYIAGSEHIPAPIAAQKYSFPHGDPAVIGYHAFIQSYPTELQAMKILIKNAHTDFSLMVDTYDLKKGIKNAIKAISEYPEKIKYFRSITVDSGSLDANSRLVRRELDKAGLKKVRIVLASNLDEYKIASLMKKKTPADSFIVSTEAATVSDSPTMEVVYKICEVIKGKKVEPKMKLSAAKQSMPGKKQVFRTIKNNQYAFDTIGLDSEKLGRPLLKPIIRKGRFVYGLPSVDQARQYLARDLKKLPSRLKRIDKEYNYSVKTSPQLRSLITRTKKSID